MEVGLSDHAGNHIDAPWHFGPTVEGKPAKTIDQVPLEWCIGKAVRLDFRSHLGRDITADDLEAEVDRVGAVLEPGVIVLLWTGADQYIDDEDKYFQCQGGLSPEGLHWILDSMTKAMYADQPQFFPLHFVGRAREHMHLEKLTNLGSIPRPTGFVFAAFPAKLRHGSAGWVRPVALVPRSHFG
jgi:kynurenine formamidase